VFGPTIDSIQHELLPSLSGGALEPDREALVRSAVGRLLMQFGDYDAGLVQLERAVDQLPARSVPRAASLLWLGWPYGSPHPVSWHLDQVRRAVAAIPDDLAPADRLMLDRLHVTRLLFLGDILFHSPIGCRYNVRSILAISSAHGRTVRRRR